MVAEPTLFLSKDSQIHVRTCSASCNLPSGLEVFCVKDFIHQTSNRVVSPCDAIIYCAGKPGAHRGGDHEVTRTTSPNALQDHTRSQLSASVPNGCSSCTTIWTCGSVWRMTNTNRRSRTSSWTLRPRRGMCKCTTTGLRRAMNPHVAASDIRVHLCQGDTSGRHRRAAHQAADTAEVRRDDQGRWFLQIFPLNRQDFFWGSTSNPGRAPLFVQELKKISTWWMDL